jgi:hypothetical protein
MHGYVSHAAHTSTLLSIVSIRRPCIWTIILLFSVDLFLQGDEPLILAIGWNQQTSCCLVLESATEYLPQRS